jgi:hypothetical protein
LLTECAAERVALLQRHEAGARVVSHYDFNNTYQYVINREDVHLTWLYDAITDHSGTVKDVDAPLTERQADGKTAEAQATIIREDRDQAMAFVERWRERIEKVTNARIRTTLRVILGETLEQKRFFEQALAGRKDLLGRRADGAGTDGLVLPTRWVGN